MSFYKRISCWNIGHVNFLYCSYLFICSLIVSYFVIDFQDTHSSKIAILNILYKKQSVHRSLNAFPRTITKPKYRMKYILLWTNPRKFPFVYFGEGNSIFVNKSCKWTNCYVTGNRDLLSHYSEFEAIVFNGPQLPFLIYRGDLPRKRQLHQKYVYANIESAANYPFRDHTFNGFFNWTWTYKLNSDGYWGYLVIKDSNNSVIGPSEDIHWADIAHTDLISNELKLRLQKKKKAAAWLCSYCLTSSRREDYVMALQHYLQKYNLKVDVYGHCGDHQCPKSIMSRCLQMVQNNYYFYLAFENSLSEDYVTEKVLHALKYDTIPIVYGGANYSRYLPEGSYLDAMMLGPRKLADAMFEIINNETAFHSFFRWKKYYSFHSTHESPETDSYCQFCAMVNNKTLMNDHKSYDKFNAWWMHKVTKVL